jgi:gas vesicle protein
MDSLKWRAIMSHNTGSKFGCFLFGLGIGAALAVLFASKSGKDTRAYLTQKGKEGKEYAQHRAEELRARAENVVERGKEIAAQQQERISGAIDAGRETYRRVQSEPL